MDILNKGYYPEKLIESLNQKSSRVHTEAFNNLNDSILSLCAGLRIKPTERYFAYYRGDNIAAYIEPQEDRILFGFFNDIVSLINDQKLVYIRPTTFGKWNKTKGGLLGYEIKGTDQKHLKQCIEDIAFLIMASYKKVNLM
ncbi:MAG: hypothetical protein GY928_16985 [Colwellia sp.]|nr:hypothetical protein [Colwellia sp.]